MISVFKLIFNHYLDTCSFINGRNITSHGLSLHALSVCLALIFFQDKGIRSQQVFSAGWLSGSFPGHHTAAHAHRQLFAAQTLVVFGEKVFIDKCRMALLYDVKAALVKLGDIAESGAFISSSHIAVRNT